MKMHAGYEVLYRMPFVFRFVGESWLRLFVCVINRGIATYQYLELFVVHFYNTLF